MGDARDTRGSRLQNLPMQNLHLHISPQPPLHFDFELFDRLPLFARVRKIKTQFPGDSRFSGPVAAWKAKRVAERSEAEALIF